MTLFPYLQVVPDFCPDPVSRDLFQDDTVDLVPAQFR
jgi:hypothetical protein